MKKVFSTITILCIAGLCLITSKPAAIMRGMSTVELTRASDVAIEGEVKDVKSHWSSDGKIIVSRALIVNTRAIRGSVVQRQIIVEYEGGEVGGMGFRVSDVAPLEKGERVILFLRSGKSRINGNAFTIVGKGQGKYVVGNDGVARKGGFSVLQGTDVIDNNIPVDMLIDKIKRVQ